MSQWYYARNGQRFGPVTDEQLKELATSGQILPADSIWKEGMDKWTPASNLKGLFPEASSSSVPPPMPPDPAPTNKFCRNCGASVAEQAVACMSCGLAPTNGNNFCRNCGAETNPAAIVCVKCGVSLTQAACVSVQSVKSQHYDNVIWHYLFESVDSTPAKPGYWKAKPAYWIGLLIGLITMPIIVGFFIVPFLGVAAHLSRTAWRSRQLIAAIREK